MSGDRARRFIGITDNLNKVLSKQLQNFGLNTEWSDISNWLTGVQSVLRDYPSPYISDKVLLSKRLNQCLNPVLPASVHQQVLQIHRLIFNNLRISVEGNINDYIKQFGQQLGIYSVSLLPHFVHTSSFDQRLLIIQLLHQFFIDLGKQLIPMLPGLLKALLSVRSTTIHAQLTQIIDKALAQILVAAGRRYTVGIVWSHVLRYSDCRLAGIQFLSRHIQQSQKKDQDDEQTQRGFSQLQRQLEQQKDLQIKTVENIKVVDNKHIEEQLGIRYSQQKLLEHLQKQEPSAEKSDTVSLNSPYAQFTEIQQINTEEKKTQLYNIKEEVFQQSVSSLPNPSINDAAIIKTQQKQNRDLFQSQSPFGGHTINSSSIALNSVPLMLSEGIKAIREGIDDASLIQNNFPNISTLVVNSLVCCLQGDENLVKRAALDFMISHLKVKSQLLSQNSRQVLVQGVLRLFKKKELSLTKRVNRWLFGKQDQQNRYTITQKNKFVLKYIINGLRKILQTIPVDIQDCTYPLRVLQNFYIQHPHLVEQTLGDISMPLLRYIFNFGSKVESWSKNWDFSDEVLKIGKRFLQNLPSYYQKIFQSLGQCYLKGVKQNKDQLAFEAVKYIDFCYITLMKHQHGLEQLCYITLTIRYLSEGLACIATVKPNLDDVRPQTQRLYKIYLKDAVLLLLNFVRRKGEVQIIYQRQQLSINSKYYQQTGQHNLPIERINAQKQNQIVLAKLKQQFIAINGNMDQFFVRLGGVVRGYANVQSFEQTFKLSAMAVVRIQNGLPELKLSQQTKLPNWFVTLQGGIKVSNPLVSLSAIEAMIDCLMWQGKHSIYKWIKDLVLKQKAQKIGTDYQKLALQKLWSLLDYPHMHNRIIDLIVAFSRYFPYQFTQTVKRSFNTHSAPDKQASIQRFSHFWRLTAYKFKDLLVTHPQFVQLNKVGLFRMLDFLDDQNPLVRHAAKNWLMQSMSLLTRVIQPLLQQLISGCTDWYETPRGVFLIQKQYDTQNIFSTFRRIRSILSNGSYSFLRFVYQTQISSNLDQFRTKITSLEGRLLTIQDDTNKKNQKDLLTAQRQPVLPKALESIQKTELKGQKMTYLDLLVVLAVRYIEGHAVQSLGVQFYIGNSGVNASAVELIQTLLDYIDHPILCEKLIDYISSFLFKVLGQVVLHKQYIMQIQLINLLRSIFFNSSFRKKAELEKVRSFFRRVFTNKTFVRSVLEGLNTPFAYVRSQFISFITASIPLIADFLQPSQCTECVRHILYTYYKIIKDIGNSLIKTVQQQVEQLDSPPQNLSLSKISQLQIRIKAEQKFVKFSQNLKQVSKTNQILSVLQGVQAVLNYFYDLNKIQTKDIKFQFTNPYTLFDTFKKIVTLGFANTQKDAKIVQRKNFLHNFQTCQALLNDLEPVYETILRSWPLSQEFARIGSEQMSAIGMRGFNFERFSRYNKLVKELISYVETQKQSIWGKIYCIMQPMFVRFPKDITDIYLKLWIRQCSSPMPNGKLPNDSSKTQLLMKMMETIIVNNFPTQVLIHAFLQSTAVSQLTHFYQKKNSDKKGNVLDYQIDCAQSRLMYFLYVYFTYVYLNQKQLTYQPLLQIWSLIMKALRPFRASRSPMSAIWTLQIISMCAKKYSPKQLLKNQKFKSDLHDLINQKLKYVASVASRKEVFFFSQPLKVGFDQPEDTKNQYHIVLPLPPTIYQIYKSHKQAKNSTDKMMLRQYRAGQKSQIQARYRFYCFKVLKKLGLQILQNTYLPEKMHFVVKRVVEWAFIIMQIIQDKSLGNQIFAQCASQVIFQLFQKARVLVLKDMKIRVLEVFNKDDFFICNVNTLQYWARIIDWVVGLQKNNQTYMEYLSKVTLSSSYFTSQSVQNKKRIKSFERICFILYSGTKDKYANKLKPLIQKIAEVIKKPQNVHAALLILLLFALRILILRLSQISLSKLFIDIWPMILTLLMQTFSRQMVRVHINNEISKNPNYLLAALKLIQMISLANLPQFSYHQWIFITDYFGVQFTVNEMTQQMTQLFSKRPELSRILSTDPKNNTSPFLYKPYLLNYVPQSSINYIPEVDPEAKAIYKQTKRVIIVKDSFIKDQNELRLKSLLLMQYMIRLAQFRVFVDWSQVEQVIVNDFINLDSFIHQIS